jgi:hypothetical protein
MRYPGNRLEHFPRANSFATVDLRNSSILQQICIVRQARRRCTLDLL